MTEPTTPADAWEMMRLGNERFVAGAPHHPRQNSERRNELAHTQAPRAALFGCSDSRLAAEIIFDLGLGDLFVVRNAGQVISDSAIGSLEYAAAVLHVPLIVVLAHDECGAVRAAIDSTRIDSDPLPANIWRQIAPIVPAARKVIRSSGTDPASVSSEAVGLEHLRGTVSELLRASELISELVSAGTLAVVGANYRLAEGSVATDIAVGPLSIDDTRSGGSMEGTTT